VFILASVDARFLYDSLYHTVLVHVVVELLVSGDPDAYELLVSNLVYVLVEYLDDIVPFVKVLLGAEPAEVIAVCHNDNRFLCRCPLEEELEVPWSVLVSGFCEALVELYGEVLACGWKTV
jgi:hypothetical protein